MDDRGSTTCHGNKAHYISICIIECTLMHGFFFIPAVSDYAQCGIVSQSEEDFTKKNKIKKNI